MSTENPYPPPPAGPPNPGYPPAPPPTPQPGVPQPPSQPYIPPTPQAGAPATAGPSQYPQPSSPAARLTAGFPPGNYPPVPGMATGAVAEPPKKKLLLPILIGALAVVLIGGGVAFAGLALGWFGGSGKQPYEVIPGTAIAYLQVDLNPSNDQKIAALGFFKELPELANANSSSVDIKKVIWDAISENRDLNGVNYDADLKPWLGDRVGVAALPNSSGSTVGVIAVQVTNEASAKDKLPSVLTKVGSELELVTVKDGYAILTDPTTSGTVKSALDGDSLTKNANFSADLNALGNTGWSAGWFDVKALAKLSSTSGLDAAGLTGRATYALRFSGNTLELAGRLTGSDSKSIPASNGGTDLGDLPADTGFAASIQGGGDWVAANWDLVQSALSSNSAYSSLTEADITAVLGKQATIGVSSDALKAVGSGSRADSTPGAGYKANTDNAARVQELFSSTYYGSMYKSSVVGSVVAIATTDSYLSGLTGNSGDKLSSSAKFTAVVPDYSKASIAVYLDLGALSTLWDKLPSSASDYRDFLKALTAVGISTTPTSDGATWSLRVTRS
jgi:hypothetical protein